MRDSGHAAVEMALAAGVLLLPVALMVSAFGPWSERKVMAEAVAAEASRAAVIHLDVREGQEFVDRFVSSSPLNSNDIRLGWCGAAPAVPFGGDCPLSRGSTVDVVVEIWTPLVSTPWGDVGHVWVRGAHSEPVDLYRSLE